MGPWTKPDPVMVDIVRQRVDAVNRRIDFAKRHPDFSFSFPWETKSGQWEVITPKDGVLGFDAGQLLYMMNILEERYP